MLHRVVREHKATLFAEAEARSASGRGYPPHVRDEFDKYERCGILAYGLIRARCQTCGDEQVVALSCKRRTLCSSCAGRRMSEVTTHLVEDVLPVARYRQWTLSVPWRVRVLLMVHPELVSRLQRLLVRVLSTYARRQARDLMAVRGTPLRRGAKLLTGAVVSIQRFGSRLTLHIHMHLVVPDAVWLRGGDGTLTVIDLPAPSDDDVAKLAHTVCRKMTAVVGRWQEARGEVEAPEEAEELTSLVMADLGAAAPRIDEEPTQKRRGRLAAMCDGYSLECRPNVGPHDRRGLARLLRYGTRPAFSQERLSLENGRVVYKLAKPFWTGQTHVILEPVEFLRRIAALIPPCRFHGIRYHGIFAAAAKDRAKACALAPPVDDADEAVEGGSEGRGDRRPGGAHAVSVATQSTAIAAGTRNSADDPTRDAPYRKRQRMEWARLLAQVFAVDVLRCPCGGERKVIAALTRRQSPDALRRYLEHIGEPAVPPPSSSARAPPQAELSFGAPADAATADTADTADPRDSMDPMPDWDAHFAD